MNDQGGASINIEKDISPTLRSEAHQHEPVIVYNSSGDGVSSTLDSNYYKGQGEREATEREFVCYMVEMTSTKNTVIENGVSTTLTARMGTGGGR